ncbi:hypothetical protein GF1_16930 [Desulfolithobacter dissulfuricans]|uniref:Uncharacterized protein n=1 Tax=Desulfolithobacter dissulfuricans TaxID=2795293 RepID=A0A915U2H9_9BACT|nr:hypothetical protein [Desulfolithobacter dissulfuricans]BCO09317.1 hypothetical protein GF1_16930 [Desulfolithobacter dissulfuricans]
MSKDSNSRNDTNATIVTTDQGHIERPKNLLNAISDIQQFYVIEKEGQDIPCEFLTIERTLDFFKIGIKSGFHEGLALALLMPFISFYMLPFILKEPDTFTKILFGSLPYMVLVVNTLLCSYVSRYYVGNITRKSINSLFGGRIMSLITKAFLIYVFYLVLYRISTPERVWELSQYISKNLGLNPKSLYYGYLKIKPYLVPVATESAVLMVVGAVVPYGMVYSLDIWNRYKSKRNERIISAK